MANKKLFAGILVMALVFGMLLVACDNGTTSSIDSALNGTWGRGTDEIYFNNGNLEMVLNGSKVFKATYTAKNGSYTFTVTHIWGGRPEYQGMLQSKWYTKAEIKSSPIGPYVTDADLNSWFTTESGTYSVSGNKLTLDGDVYTKR